LFFDGEYQAVELPDEFKFEGTVVYIWRRPETGEVVLSARPPEVQTRSGPAPEES
jgi:antitoxin VapB